MSTETRTSKRVDPHRPAHDDRIEHVVLDLLVHDEHDDGDDERDQALGQSGDDRCRDPCERATDHRQEVDERDPESQQTGRKERRGS